VPALSVYIYHGQNKEKSAKLLRGYDVILTSYGTLVAEFPKEPKKKKKVLDEDGEEIPDAAPPKKQVYGPLCKIEWYVCRVPCRLQMSSRHSTLTRCLLRA
jgi:SNF2 family DNA or RNA helicase